MRPALVGALALGLAGTGSRMPAVGGREPWLELPQAQQRVDGNGFLELDTPAESVQQLVLHIPGGSSHINYGMIHTKVNTEASDIAMTSSSGSDGLVLRVDLNGAGGFPMRGGRNSVELEYQDQFGRTKYYNFVLDFTKGPAGGRGFTVMEAAKAPEKRSGQLYAVVIGISHYGHGGAVSDLRYADKDAESFLEFLKSKAGGQVSDANVTVLLNEQATTVNVRKALFTFLTVAQPQDTVAIYIAGHGAQDPHDPRNLYLLTADSDPNDMGGTAFPMWQLQDVFSRILKSKRVITIADTCHSYGFSGQRTSGEGNNLINQYIAHYAGSGQRAVITASDISEPSYEDAKWGGGHGVFTYYLLKGLQGEADANHDGTVTAGELFAYLQRSVPGATESKQHPRAQGGLASMMPVSLLR